MGMRWWWGLGGTRFWLVYVMMSCLLLFLKVLILIYFRSFDRLFGFLESYTIKLISVCFFEKFIKSNQQENMS
jgi:hypothetical protein